MARQLTKRNTRRETDLSVRQGIVRYWVSAGAKVRGGWQVRRVKVVDGKEVDGGLFSEENTKAEAKKIAAEMNRNLEEMKGSGYGSIKNPGVTDRALRYRANATPPPTPKVCGFCGITKQIQVGHVNGHEEDGEPENLIWTCRSCNQFHANGLRTFGLGRLTRQYNPPAKGAANLYQYALAVDSIQKRDPSTGKLRGWEGKTRPMEVQQAVAMIRATPHSERSRFAREMWRHRKRGNPISLDPRYFLKHGTVMVPPRLSKPKVQELQSRGITHVQSYKGIRIWQEGEGWRTSLDRESEFDTLKDAKQFIDAAAKRHLNPRSAFHEAYRKAKRVS